MSESTSEEVPIRNFDADISAWLVAHHYAILEDIETAASVTEWADILMRIEILGIDLILYKPADLAYSDEFGRHITWLFSLAEARLNAAIDKTYPQEAEAQEGQTEATP